MASLLPVPEPPDPVEGALGHFDHSNWVKQALKNLDQGTVHSAAGAVTGGLMVDELTVDKASDETALISLKGNGVRGIIGKSTSDFARWQLILGDGTTEGGSNSGSLFKLFAFTDGGGVAHTVLQADRTSGLVTVKGSPTVAKGIATKEYVDTGMPIGAIIAFGGSTLPAEMQPYWHMCNGTAHGSAALQAIIGSANAPDLSGRFIVGTGTGYNPGVVGGAAQNFLTPAQTATKGHTHTATSQPETTDHEHLVDPPNTGTSGAQPDHSHGIAPVVYGPYNGANQDADISYRASPTKYASLRPQGTGGASPDHGHYVDIAAFLSGGINRTHTHVIAVTGTVDANATAPIDNRPPFYALIYIIKKA